MNKISWVKINKGCVKSEKDCMRLNAIQDTYKANYNTSTGSSMWFDFKTHKDAVGFASDITKTFSYLTVTLGRN